MSSSFEDRKRQEEARYQHDQEFLFKVRNRRNRLFGLYVAELLGLSGPDADAYAKEVVLADFERPGDEDVFEKVRADLAAKGVEVSDHTLRKRFEVLEATAREQIKAQ